MATTLNTDSSADITLAWLPYSQGANPASGLLLFWKTDSSAPSALTTADNSIKLPVTATSYTFAGVPADLHYRFGIAAYKTTLDGMAITDIKDHASWQDVQPTTTPNFTGNIDGEAAATVKSNAQDGASAKSTIDANRLDLLGYDDNTDFIQIDKGAGLIDATLDEIVEGAANKFFSGKTQDDLPDGTTYKQYSNTEKTKLSGIETGATVGAKAGTNLVDSGNNSLGDADVITSQGTANDTSNVSSEAAADIKNKVQGMDTAGSFIGKGAGNQRIVIDFENGRIYFYDAADAEILKFGENVVGTYDGVDLGNLGVIAGGGTDRSGNQSPIYLNASTNHSTNVLNQVVFVENVQIHASNSATIRAIKGIATHLGTGMAIGVYGEASSTGGIAWAGYFEGDVYVNGNIDIVGSLKMDGSDIIDTDGYQVGVLKTRQTLMLGRDTEISVGPGGSTKVDAQTLTGAENGQGYRMLRAGKVTGISLQYDVTTSGTGTFKATVQKNGVNQSMNASSTLGAGDQGASSTANAFTFAANDTINVELELKETAISGPVGVDDVAIIIEFEA